MAGLARICRLYGSMKVNNMTYYWDYVAEEPVDSKDMPHGSKRWKASERRRAELIAKERRDNSDGRKS